MNMPPQDDNTPNVAKDAAIERAIDDQRILGESRMIRTETPADRITDEQCANVIEAVKAYMKEKGCTQSQLARALVLSSPTVNQVLKGNYPADARPIIAAMDRWLERRKSADEQPHVSQFVWTHVAKTIRLAARRAIASADMGIDSRIALVWGDPGCGKTLALEAIAQSEDAILITCGVDVISPRAILGKIGEALRITLGTSAREAFANIVERLRGSGKLLIVDEIHALLDARNDNAFHTLRRLSDQTGCPQLWAATCNLIDQLRFRERKREPLGQIISRIGCQLHLTKCLHNNDGGRAEPLFTVDEILQVYGRNELKLTRDAGRFLARLCTSPLRGLLRTCTQMVMDATMAHRAKSQALTVHMLWEAAQLAFQESILTELATELREELAEAKLALMA